MVWMLHSFDVEKTQIVTWLRFRLEDFEADYTIVTGPLNMALTRDLEAGPPYYDTIKRPYRARFLRQDWNREDFERHVYDQLHREYRKIGRRL